MNTNVKVTKLDLFKGAVGFVVGAGVASIVSGFVERVAPTDTPIQKVLVYAGKTGISWLATSKVVEHVNEKIDNGAEWLDENVGTNLLPEEQFTHVDLIMN